MPFLVEKNKIKRAASRLKRAFLPASAVVEGSLVIPIFVFSISILINLIIMLGVQLRIREAAFSAIREASIISVPESKSGGMTGELSRYGYAYSKLKESIQKSEYASKMIDNGTEGVVTTLNGATSNGARMTLSVSYSLKASFSFMTNRNENMKQELVTYVWAGEEYINNDMTNDSNYVYLAPYGEVYHTDASCTYLKPEVFTTDTFHIGEKRNVSGAKYYECEKCGKYGEGETLYCTKYGTRYHKSSVCTGITHDYSRLPISEAQSKGLHKCSKCK